MGSFTQADSVIVRWLSGNADILYDVGANQILTIVEGSSPINNCDNANISSADGYVMLPFVRVMRFLPANGFS